MFDSEWHWFRDVEYLHIVGIIDWQSSSIRVTIQLWAGNCYFGFDMFDKIQVKM